MLPLRAITNFQLSLLNTGADLHNFRLLVYLPSICVGEMHRLPPLNVLRTFEAVARLSSFKLAAEELYVTQSAVSQQIKTLEEHFGVRLFIRHSKGIELTENAVQFLPAVTQAFDILRTAAAGIDRKQQNISVSTSTSFAISWLMLRFMIFEQDNPDISIYINAAPKGIGVNALSRYDLEVCYCINDDDLDPELVLLKEWLLPVCSPEYKNQSAPTLATVVDMRLLLNSPEASDWKPWLAAHGFKNSKIKSSLTKAIALPTDASAIEMAIGGYGIALANLHYVSDRLEAGLVVPAFDVDAFAMGTHYMEYDRQFIRPSIARLLTWLHNEAAGSQKNIARWLKV